MPDPTAWLNRMAIETVHTSGINWDSVLLIVCSIIVAFITLTAFLRQVIRSNRKEINDQIDRSVKAMAEILNIKFEDVQRRLDNLERNRYGRR